MSNETTTIVFEEPKMDAMMQGINENLNTLEKMADTDLEKEAFQDSKDLILQTLLETQKDYREATNALNQVTKELEDVKRQADELKQQFENSKISNRLKNFYTNVKDRATNLVQNVAKDVNKWVLDAKDNYLDAAHQVYENVTQLRMDYHKDIKHFFQGNIEKISDFHDKKYEKNVVKNEKKFMKYRTKKAKEFIKTQKEFTRNLMNTKGLNLKEANECFKAEVEKINNMTMKEALKDPDFAKKIKKEELFTEYLMSDKMNYPHLETLTTQFNLDKMRERDDVLREIENQLAQHREKVQERNAVRNERQNDYNSRHNISDKAQTVDEMLSKPEYQADAPNIDNPNLKKDMER